MVAFDQHAAHADATEQQHVLRQGAVEVTNFELLPEPSAKRPGNNPWPQWARIKRISSSVEEMTAKGGDVQDNLAVGGLGGTVTINSAGSLNTGAINTAGVAIADAIRFGNGMGDVPNGPGQLGTFDAEGLGLLALFIK